MILPRPFRDARGNPSVLLSQILAIDEMHHLEERKGVLIVEIHYDEVGIPAKAWVRESVELNLLDRPAPGSKTHIS